MIKFEKGWQSIQPLWRVECVVNGYCLKGYSAVRLQNVLILLDNLTATTYYDVADLKKAKSIGLDYILDDVKFDHYIKGAGSVAATLIQYSKKIRQINLSKLTRSKLKKIYIRYIDLFSKLFNYYTFTLPYYLSGVECNVKISLLKYVPDDCIDDIFNKLITPSQDTILTKHEIAQLSLAKYILKKYPCLKTDNICYLNKIDSLFSLRLKNLVRKYSWISTQENNAPLDKEYYLQQIQRYHMLGFNECAQKIIKLKSRSKKIRKEKKYLKKIYSISNDVLHTAEKIASLAHLRLAMRFDWTLANYYARSLFQEINKRLDYKEKKIGEFYFSELISQQDVCYGLDDKKSIISSSLVRKKIKKVLLLMFNNKINIYYNKQADDLEKKYISHVDVSNIKEIKGQIANKGKLHGFAWVVSAKDEQVKKASQMKKGMILVAPMTRPQMIGAMSKSAAIITDEGGITSHAAIVSRELDVPCIIGTKIATNVLKDGDYIEVDANMGIVRILD